MSSSPERSVRVHPDFFAALDRQLPAERSDTHPSRHDFLAYDLPLAMDRIRLGFDELSEQIPGRPDYRVLILAGYVVDFVVIYAQLAPDGAVVITDVEIELRTASDEDDLPDETD